jgi:hypothetical protein
MAARLTPHQKAEKALTAYGLTLPETTVGPGWQTTRALYVRKKMVCVFGDKDQAPDELSIIVKLPVSAEMVQQLYFVMESKGWWKQHDWVRARFGPDDDILAELDTLKAWIRQSYIAVAPKKLGKMLATPEALGP